MILKHLPEKLIVGESMFFKDICNLQIGCQNIFINSGETNLILIFKKSEAHMFFEKSAKIFFLKHGNSGDFFYRNWSGVVFCNII